MNYRIKEVGNKTEISIVFSTPTVDIPYIRFANERYSRDCYGRVETIDKAQFERLKETFKSTHFSQQKFWEKSCKFYKRLNELKDMGILNDDINCDVDEYGNPLDYPEYTDLFMSCSIAYMEGENIQKDGLYFYPIIEDWHIQNALEFVKDEYKDDLLRTLPLVKFIYGDVKLRCDFILDAFNDLKMHDNKIRYTYIMSDASGYYKIGKSFYPEYRKNQLATGNPTIKLEFFINGDREYEIQKHFEHKKVRGEWYNLTKADLKYIRNYNNIRNKQRC